jgi:hypothetical protein
MMDTFHYSGMMKRILLQLDTDRFVSTFDAIMAYDVGVDCVLQYGGVKPNDVPDLIHGVMFTRREADLRNSAVFVGGSDVSGAEAILRSVQGAFFGPLRVSVMLDANGCNTTAAAATARVLSVGQVAGKPVVVLAGTGPVGLRTAAFLAEEGAHVILTSRSLARAQAACASIEERFGVQVSPADAAEPAEIRHTLDQAYAVIATGAAGIRLLPAEIWMGHPTLRVLADVNAVPPLGIEGIEPSWDRKEVDGKVIFGALGVGGLKRKVHRTCIACLFERNDWVLDAEAIRGVAREIE